MLAVCCLAISADLCTPITDSEPGLPPPSLAGCVCALLPHCRTACRPAGFTPDPLDYSFCWHLLSVLGALGTLPPAADNLPEGEPEAEEGCRPLVWQPEMGVWSRAPPAARRMHDSSDASI